MTFRQLLVHFAIGVAASVATVAAIEAIREHREKKKLGPPPVAPGYGTV